MRNLKRALSLVMAAAMLIGMMVVGASASYNDFTDKDEIVNDEAVSVLVTLSVISGKEDGSYYDPTGIVTRAEMAKMITVALNGGKDPVLGVKDTPSFTDIKGTWAESYIEYCTSPSVGVVSGRGDGTFDPTATVTAAEAAKMLLVALGYDADVFGLTGGNWQINTDVNANNAKLYNGLDISSNAPLTRDNAAQMVYNALNAYVMVKSYDKILSNGQISYNYNLSSTKTLLSEKFGVIKVTGVVTGNEFIDGVGMKGKTALDVTNYGATNEQNVLNDGTFAVATGADEIGKSVTLFVKPYASAPSNTARATVLGDAVINSSNIIYTTSKALVNDSTKANDITATLKAEGLKFDDANAVKLYTNYVASNVTTPVTSIASLLNTSGVDAQYIDNNGDGKVDVVTFVQRNFGKVLVTSTAKDGTLSISSLGAFGSALSTQKASEDVYDFANLGVAKDDYVFYYRVNNGLYYVEKAESVTVDVTATQGSTSTRGTGTKATASGTVYTESGLAGTYMNANSNTTLAGAVTIGKSAVLYLDGNGDVVFVTDVAADPHYLMVVESNDNETISSFNPLQAKMVLEDGSIVTAQISSIGNTVVSNSNKTLNEFGAASAKIYSYTVDANGKYALVDAATATTTVNSDATSITNNNPTVGGKVANNNTIFVMGNATGTAYTVYTGINSVPTTTSIGANDNVALSTNSTDVLTIVFAKGGTGAASTGKNIYVLNATPTVTKNASNANVYTYKALVDGVETDLIATGASAANAFASTGLFTNQTVGAGNTISASAQISGGVDATDVTSCGNGVITGTIAASGSSSTGSLTYNDSTKVIVIDRATGAVSEGSIEMITVVSGNSAATTDVVMTRAAALSSLPGYNVAGIVYILQ